MRPINITEPEQTKLCESNVEIAVGIDFGTTHSLIAISRNQNVHIITDHEGHSLIPSIAHSIKSIKRLLGKSTEEILENPKLYKLVSNIIDQQSKKIPKLNIDNRSMTIPEVAAEIFIYLKKQAERELKATITDAVVTIPAYFDDAAKGEVLLAAKIAGFKILRLIVEPTSAAYAYGLNKNITGCYVIYDLGGGTFDISVLHMQVGILQVIAAGGDNMLGGDDIDELIASYFANKYNIKNSQKLLKLAKFAKETLSTEEHFTILSDNQQLSLDRKTFEDIVRPLIERSINITKDTIEQVHDEDIVAIVLVGGSSRIPLISKMLYEYFTIAIFSNINPDEAVVVGAALQAENLTMNHTNALLIDVVTLSLGIELYGNIVEKIILRNSPIPLSITKEFTNHADNQTGIYFHIVQGEREMASDCRSLAKFELTNLPKARAGTLKIEVTFSLDADNILSVSALETSSNQSHIVIMKPTFGLDGESIDKILEDAYKNIAKDHNNRLLQKAKLKAQTLIKDIEKMILETKNFVSISQKKKIHQVIIDLKYAIYQNNIDLIIKRSEMLDNVTKNPILRKLNHMITDTLSNKHIESL
jgi:molecular chaperone HscA